MRSTEDVLDHHAKCFFEFDLEGILSDYSPTAVLFTPDGPLRGADAIRPLFQAMFAEFGKPGATFHMKHQSVEGKLATSAHLDVVRPFDDSTRVRNEGRN